MFLCRYVTENSLYDGNQSSTEIVSSQYDIQAISQTKDIHDRHEEQLPFSGEYNTPLALSHLQEDEITQSGKFQSIKIIPKFHLKNSNTMEQ